MVLLRDLRKKLERVDINTQSVKIIQKDEKVILDLNKSQLFRKGEDSLSVPLPEYRSKIYAAEKVFKNPNLPFGRPDLKLTGNFYSRFTLTVGYTGIFTIDSNDSKAAKLEAKYGKFIYGLNEYNRKLYAIETFYPKLQTYFTSRTGLQFNR